MIGDRVGLLDIFHIAPPQHTAVNYLQVYYQGFVINKPSCVLTQPPTSLESLLAYTEQDLVKALPINHTYQWLLSSHVPYLVKCVETARAIAENSKDTAAYGVPGSFHQEPKASEAEFQRYAEARDADDVPYSVLKPRYNAVCRF
ncbi:hypothetical protein PENFLA_c015G10307 [Penicillium flavigenum]|uniref:Uncharacterized protein n=1 Tax=Penicillium flavigenum TaxID=254877 RepID=A0A1V6T504_9EURO|nr:hypothetical protein PENFLA_c015G10307 [Penicillium flavigenum]